MDHGKLSTKKDVQLESCELSFICGKMGTAAQEAASQIGLRDFSKAAMEESQYYKVSVKEHSFYKRVFVSLEDLMSP